MTPIPRHFHFVFGLKPQTEPFHIAFYLCLKSCLEVNQPDKVSLYYHFEPQGPWWEKIKPHLDLVKVELEEFVISNPGYMRHQEGLIIQAMKLNYAHQADFIRLKALIDHGGVYADMDTLFVNPVPESLYSHDFVIGVEDENVDQQGNLQPCVCNALMLSRAHAFFPTQWLANMYGTFDGSWNRHSNVEASALASLHPDEVFVVPRHYFYKHRFTPEGITMLFEQLDDNFDDVYSMHLWSHLWWNEFRTDFSTFHAGLLTEDYIHNTDTTYTVVARRYL